VALAEARLKDCVWYLYDIVGFFAVLMKVLSLEYLLPLSRARDAVSYGMLRVYLDGALVMVWVVDSLTSLKFSFQGPKESRKSSMVIFSPWLRFIIGEVENVAG